jgi:peptidoglycan-associated lipoprotein
MKIKNVLALGIMVLSISLAGCAKKPTVNPDDSLSGTGDGEVTDGTIGGIQDSDSGNAMGIQTIYFPFDSFEIVGENREILKNNISILKDNPTVNVQVEGHCDERGGIQYNLALGEKRANAIKQQLAAGGISGSRVTIISMGKEKPLDPSSGEDAWAKNRRGNFVITSK